MKNTDNTGLKIERGFCDDAAESKFFTGEVNALDCKPEPCTVQIRVGYDLDSILYLHDYKTMAEKQAAFDRDSMLYTVSSLAEFRVAVIDGAIIAEQKRVEYGTKIINSTKIYTRKIWDWIRLWGNKYPDVGQWNHDHVLTGDCKRPRIHVFLSTPQRGCRDDRCFILGDEIIDRTPWHWSGFQIENIDWKRLYSQLLRTEQHRKNLMCLFNSIV